MLRKFKFSLIVLLALLNVVMPNTAKFIAISAVVGLAVIYFYEYGAKIFRNKYFIYYLSSFAVTLVYLMVGYFIGLEFYFGLEIFAVYAITPVLLGIISNGFILDFGIKKINLVLLGCLFLGIVSQIYYFLAFINLGPEYVEFLVEEPNVDITERYSGAVMYVFGSMIFLIGGLIASPNMIQNKTIRYILITLAICAAFSSGRSALILAFFIGLILSMCNGITSKFDSFIENLLNLIILFSSTAICFYIFIEFFDIDFSLSIDILLDKLISRGGDGRNEQSYALINGIIDNNLILGAGHGIGVEYLVDPIRSWRYELVWLATIYRVGLIGALIYAAPFLFILFKALPLLFRGKLSADERFLLGGYFCSFLASNTNPYIESFIFQWMFILPIFYFLSRNKFIVSVKH